MAYISKEAAAGALLAEIGSVNENMVTKHLEGGLVLAMQVISKLPEDNAVHLPCKKGDPLFVLTSDSPLGYEKTKCKKMTVVFREDGPAVKVTAPSVCDDWGGAVWEFYPEDFGIKVFTKESDARMFATRP